ncbi:MAG: VPLPA-CTERM sorting domain-containing protein, partial [Gammaproteobacteria bacterium]
NWGPGTATSRTLGGDDTALGSMQDISAYDGFTTVTWFATTLVLANTRCGGTPCAPSAAANSGFRMTLVLPPLTVPVPAAAWLFGGGLAALGFLRRRQGALTTHARATQL